MVGLFSASIFVVMFALIVFILFAGVLRMVR